MEQPVEIFIVKLFEESPFDKSKYIKNVQVLCNKDTGEPYAQLDSLQNWVGLEVSSEDITLDWMNKKSKHLVPGDSVLFGEKRDIFGIVKEINEAPEDDDDWNDEFVLIDCKHEYANHKLFSHFENKSVQPINRVPRRFVEHKSYLCAKIKNDNIQWKKLENEFKEFFKICTKPEEHIAWWKQRVEPKN